MRAPRPPGALFDLSTPDGWMDAHERASAALSAASFAHPGCSKAEIRMDPATGWLLALAEQPRRARAPVATLRLDGSESSAQAFADAMACPRDESLSLASLLAAIASHLLACSSGRPEFAARLNPTVGLGCSERWDENFSDGLGRGPDGARAFEQACSECHGRFAELALDAASAGARFLQGEAKEACLRVLADLEAEHVGQSASRPAPARESGRPVRSRL